MLSVSKTESRFTARERSLLLASRRSEKVIRGQHGRPMSEATDSKNQFAYRVRGPFTDWAQRKLNETEAAYKKKHPDVDMTSLHFTVEKVDD